MTKQADFYRWLRERNQRDAEQPQKRVQLEIPEAPKYEVPVTQVERGVFIIQF